MGRTLFNYEDNRLDYGSLLMPELGFDVDFAVAFTYSLDLEALLGVPVSMGLLEDTDSGLMDNPYFLLEAIRKSSDKIAIFANAGSIALPRNIKSVFALLEDSVFEVALSGMRNFHPKMWFIRYTNDAGARYIKLIILSRNLTFDRSFDYAIEMTGTPGRRKLNKNAPLSDMLKFAAGSANPQKRKKILALADEILMVTRFSLDDRFEDYEFIPLGLESGAANKTMLGGRYKDIIVFSPFLSHDVAAGLAGSASRRKTLFSRKGSLTKDILDSYDDVYITKDVILDNEITSSEETSTQSGCDIHAKLYFTHGDDGNYLYVGSANASHKAFYENVEFLLKLKFKRYMMGYDLMLKDFLPDYACPFEKVTDIAEDAPLSDDIALDKAFREALRGIKGAEVTPQGERFNITLLVKSEAAGKTVYIAPLFRSNRFAPLVDGLVFGDMLLRELSEFFIIRIEDRQIVTKIALSGMPEGRDQAIYKSIIQDKNGFLSYVSFMLSDNYSESYFEENEIAKRLLDGIESQSNVIPPALYERMLACTVNNPHKLLDLENLMNKLDADIVNEDFARIYQPFREIAKKVTK